jgi:hypothetical protein
MPRAMLGHGLDAREGWDQEEHRQRPNPCDPSEGCVHRVVLLVELLSAWIARPFSAVSVFVLQVLSDHLGGHYAADTPPVESKDRAEPARKFEYLDTATSEQPPRTPLPTVSERVNERSSQLKTSGPTSGAASPTPRRRARRFPPAGGPGRTISASFWALRYRCGTTPPLSRRHLFRLAGP